MPTGRLPEGVDACTADGVHDHAHDRGHPDPDTVMKQLGPDTFWQLRRLLLNQQHEYRYQLHTFQWLLLQHSMLQSQVSQSASREHGDRGAGDLGSGNDVVSSGDDGVDGHPASQPGIELPVTGRKGIGSGDGHPNPPARVQRAEHWDRLTACNGGAGGRVVPGQRESRDSKSPPGGSKQGSTSCHGVTGSNAAPVKIFGSSGSGMPDSDSAGQKRRRTAHVPQSIAKQSKMMHESSPCRSSSPNLVTLAQALHSLPLAHHFMQPSLLSSAAEPKRVATWASPAHLVNPSAAIGQPALAAADFAAEPVATPAHASLAPHWGSVAINNAARACHIDRHGELWPAPTAVLPDADAMSPSPRGRSVAASPFVCVQPEGRALDEHQNSSHRGPESPSSHGQTSSSLQRKEAPVSAAPARPSPLACGPPRAMPFGTTKIAEESCAPCPGADSPGEMSSPPPAATSAAATHFQAPTGRTLHHVQAVHANLAQFGGCGSSLGRGSLRISRPCRNFCVSNDNDLARSGSAPDTTCAQTGFLEAFPGCFDGAADVQHNALRAPLAAAMPSAAARLLAAGAAATAPLATRLPATSPLLPPPLLPFGAAATRAVPHNALPASDSQGQPPGGANPSSAVELMEDDAQPPAHRPQQPGARAADAARSAAAVPLDVADTLEPWGLDADLLDWLESLLPAPWHPEAPNGRTAAPPAWSAAQIVALLANPHLLRAGCSFREATFQNICQIAAIRELHRRSTTAEVAKQVDVGGSGPVMALDAPLQSLSYGADGLPLQSLHGSRRTCVAERWKHIRCVRSAPAALGGAEQGSGNGGSSCPGLDPRGLGPRRSVHRLVSDASASEHDADDEGCSEGSWNGLNQDPCALTASASPA